MKKLIQSLLALAAFGGAGLVAQAQPAPKIYVVDMAKLFDSHYKTEEQAAKLKVDEQKAQEELERLNKEFNGLVEHYKELNDQSNNPAATAEAKSKAQADAQKLLEQIQQKQREGQTFQVNTRNSFQQRFQTFKSMLVEEISKIAVDVAKRHGATLLIDKSGPTMIGVSNILYSDAAYDLTDEVAAEIAKTKPVSVAAPAAAPASTPAPDAPATSDSPSIKFPGATPAPKN